MATEARKFRIGLFVTVGVFIAVSGIIALGTRQFFSETRTYVTYFEESVQGLEPDSLVKYQGIPIGRVDGLRIAPDGHLAEVVLKIDSSVKITSNLVVQMNYAGITGMKYLEISPRKPGQPDESPRLDFQPPYRVIASKQSGLQAILTSIEQVVENLRSLDLKGIGDKIKDLITDLQGFVAKENWTPIIKNLEVTSANIKSSSERIAEMLHKPGVEDALADAAATIQSLKEMSATLQGDLESLNLSDRLATSTDKMDRFFDQARLTSEELRFLLTQQQGNIYQILENLRMASESLNNLAASLKANPAQILFTGPPAPER